MRKIKFTRNSRREGMQPRDAHLEWWSAQLWNFGVHVFNKGDGWRWKINSLMEIESKGTFTSRELAEEACQDYLAGQLRQLLINMDGLDLEAK